MKRYILNHCSSALCVLALSAVFVGCDKDNDVTISPLPETVYTGVKALNLEYNDAPMSGKSVAYSQNGDNALLVMGSEISPADISKAFEGMPSIPGPGVLPGTPELRLPVYLSPDGDEYEFKGSGETEFVTYSYSGDVKPDRLDFEFENVRLKNRRLAGKAWVPAPTERGTGLSYKSLPLHIVWDCSLPFPLEGFDGTLQDALTLMATMPVIPAYGNTAYMSLVQVIGNALKTVAFREDGNAVVTYLQSANGAAQFAQAPICMIQYLPLTDNMMKLFVTPTDLMGQIIINNTNRPSVPANPFGTVSRAGEQETPTIQGMAEILAKLAPMIAEGFPMQYTLSTDSLQIFFNTETLLPLLKGIVVPLLQDPIIQASIVEKIASNPALSGNLPLVKTLVAAFPKLLDSTTRIELGFNFVPYASSKSEI